MRAFVHLPAISDLSSSRKLKRVALRAGVGAALSIGALAAGHMMPAETTAPVRTTTVAATPAFDFGPQQPAKATDASAEKPVLAVVTPEVQAPLPAARPRHLTASASRWSSISGVERYDRCTSTCESRDPALTGVKTAAVILASAPSPQPPDIPQPPAKGVDGWVDGGRRMVSGAVDATTATFSAVQAAVLGAITPER